MKKLSVLLLPLLFLLVGCGSAAAPEVNGKTFVSTEVSGFELVAGTQIVIDFREDEITLSAGCNTIFGAATWSGNTLEVGSLATTEIGCMEELHAQDELLIELLHGAPSVTRTEATLKIAGKAGGEAVEITLEERGDSPLAGTTWNLTGVVANMGVSTLPQGVTSTLTIDGDRANLEYGCNTGGGEITATQDTLTFGALIATRMMCSAEAMDLEGHVQAVLAGEVTYAIDGLSLQIDNGDIGLRYTAEED